MPASRILILGSNGGLGRALTRKLGTDFNVTGWTRAELDFEQPERIAERLSRHDFDVLLNAAGMTSPDVCETQASRARVVNAEGPQALAQFCHQRGARLIHFSTDYVFGGEKLDPWSEDDATEPVNVYGRTKCDGELAVRRASPDALIARVSWLFGPDKSGHPDQMIEKALQSGELTAVVDKVSVPTSTSDVCDWIMHLVRHPAAGVLHLCNSGTASWHSWAETALQIAESLGVQVRTTRVEPVALADISTFKAARPLYTVMSNQRLQSCLGFEIRNWQAALEEHLASKYIKV